MQWKYKYLHIFLVNNIKQRFVGWYDKGSGVLQTELMAVCQARETKPEKWNQDSEFSWVNNSELTTEWAAFIHLGNTL